MKIRRSFEISTITGILMLLYAASSCSSAISSTDTNASKPESMGRNDKRDSIETAINEFTLDSVSQSNFIQQVDLYNQKVSPVEFLEFLSSCKPHTSVYILDPRKISSTWVDSIQVVVLSKYLNDENPSSEVKNALLSSSFTHEFKSTVSTEALKLINLYFTGKYLYGSSENEKTKEEVLVWVNLNSK